MRRLSLVMGVTGLFMAALPACAAPFDGKWLADMPAQNRCNSTATMTLAVLDGAVIGEIRTADGIGQISGKVDADGTASLTIAGHAAATAHFNIDRFDATWSNGVCLRHAEGDRAPDATAQAALAAARTAHQAAYAELVRRARAGEKVDYARLRAELVYDQNWDFYGEAAFAMQSQAYAASQGKDCAGALDKTAQALAMDFTMILAHQIRADCLEGRDRAQSRIEQNIADGLEDSLMHSGDGESQKTAYIAVMKHDEARVLGNRHLVERARQSGIRSSDGHYYDVIQAASQRGHGPQTVYFNVDGFVAGRDSNRAMLATIAAGVH
jgi:hypothetical protein